MPVFATAGSKVFIGTAMDDSNEDLVAADFADQIWTEIDYVESIGTFGDAANAIETSFIGRGRVLKAKGVRNAGNLELVAGLDLTDAGQLAVLAAEKTKANYAFKIEFADAPAIGASPKNSTRMFVGLMMTATEQLDGADNIMKLNASIGINSNIVRTQASAS
ncbi:hypothetical protein E2F50_00105 [Rhizobium deserti]|uniref:Phage tail protein n=1 Tax=Rhizobium deserti TaxID=2547961 RepID=A0A4R5ULB6_9HYPH|nr:hypothetical protein [Rhizobium deserti]TDK38603.1 hypothetical protein E2F50_00105 [Rhizobium deserti]